MIIIVKKDGVRLIHRFCVNEQAKYRELTEKYENKNTRAIIVDLVESSTTVDCEEIKEIIRQ